MARRGLRRRSDSVRAEFFKVFLPDRSSRQLLIPPDFVKDFKRTIRERITLKARCGKIWHINVEQTQKGVFLKNGWQRFVSDQCLEAGDFLVFKYDKCYLFMVNIFGTSLWKKDASAVNTTTRLKAVKVEEEDEV